VGGTSAVAPLYAGIISLINQKLGRRGFLNRTIYTEIDPTNAFNDITSGNNDTVGSGSTFQAGNGWDACTGWGSPNGTALLNAVGARSG
jgi:kumamolisin